MTYDPSRIEIRTALDSDRKDIARIYGYTRGVCFYKTTPVSSLNGLEAELYDVAEPIERLVAIEDGRIVGQGVIAEPDDIALEALSHTPELQSGIRLIDMSQGFMDPLYNRRGIWTALLLHRIQLIKSLQAIPTFEVDTCHNYMENALVDKGAEKVSTRKTSMGMRALYIFTD
jgi:GNAT superfamily N-acetyltransferase